MRIRDVPRGLPDDGDQIAESMEIGSGMKDVHAKHGMSTAERRHFEELEKRPLDPREAPSNFHDPRPPREEGLFIDDLRGPAARSGEDLCRGVVVGCFMQEEGAHIELEDEAGSVHYLFWPHV